MDATLLPTDGLSAIDFNGLEPCNLEIGGHFVAQCFDADGNLKWTDVAKNIVPNTALTVFLGICTTTRLRLPPSTWAWWTTAGSRRSLRQTP